MESTDGKRFRDLLRGMGRIFNQELDGLVLDAYWIALKDWGYEDFQRAAAHLMQHSRFMPRPADFTELRNAGRPTAGEAFAKAVRHCASSAYRDGPHPDPVVHACVQALGGYTVIAMCEEGKLPFLERRFAEHFEHISDARATRAALPKIATDSTAARLNGPRRISELLPGQLSDTGDEQRPEPVTNANPGAACA